MPPRNTFIYDGLGRLRQRQEFAWAGTPCFYWYVTETVRYIYDGMRVIQEHGSTPLVSYTRGADLSGSLEGTGGIGGLLARSHGYSGGNWSTHNFYHADGNGNVAYLVNSSQTLAAKYRYDPYGNTISSSGSLASANVYRFSSKELHVNSGLYYYGYRFYAPALQRWLNRDPIFEKGGINLYCFVANNPNSKRDSFGLEIIEPEPDKPVPRVEKACVEFEDPTWKQAGYPSARACFEDCLKCSNGYGAVPGGLQLFFHFFKGGVAKGPVGVAYTLGTIPGCYIGCNMAPCKKYRDVVIPPLNPADPNTW